MDPRSGAPKKNTSHGNEVLPQMLLISYKDHVTNEEVRAKIQQAIGPHEEEEVGRQQSGNGQAWNSPR